MARLQRGWFVLSPERPERLGPLLEAFVIGEIAKQIGRSHTRHSEIHDYYRLLQYFEQ